MKKLNKKNEFQSNNDQFFLFHHTEILEPRYRLLGKNEGNIKFLYGINPSQNLNHADYFGNNDDGKYLSNHCSSQGFPTTIIPIKGCIYFQNDENFKITQIEILPYENTNDHKKYNEPSLAYGEDDKALTKIASKEPSVIDLTQRIQNANSFDIDIDAENDDKTRLYFDLHLRKNECYTQFGKYDWESPITDQSFLKKKQNKNACYDAIFL